MDLFKIKFKDKYGLRKYGEEFRCPIIMGKYDIFF